MEDEPKQLGDFEILRELGRGGMGVVYEARQKSLNRRVALKLLSSGMGITTKAVMRFKREAEAAAKLHHTNIVPIYFTGEEGRVPYYAMELIDGPSLDQVIRQLRNGSTAPVGNAADATVDALSALQQPVPDWVAGTIGWEKPASTGDVVVSGSGSVTGSSSLASGGDYFDKVAGMMAEVADALAHAHDQGVVHRDMKPSNLLLSQEGRLSINDFGLARMLEQPGMTMTGEFMGSPMYMSPEQITAGRVPLDHRTDIYSLGATLYELLTLQPPFSGQQRDQVLSQIIHKEPPRPRSINKRIPKDLETICLKAMEKDPDRRYQTADLMAKDLRSFVNRHAISARRIGPVERTLRWARKNKALTAMACIAVIASVTAAIIGISSWREHRRLLRERAMEDALTAAMSGKLKDALKHIELAETHGADRAWTLMLQSQVDLFQGNTKAAIEKLQVAIELSPRDVTAQSMLAKAFEANGQWSDYMKELGELEKLQPRTAVEYLFMGSALSYYFPEKAAKLMDKAIDMRGDFYLARVSRAGTQVFQALDHPGGDEGKIRKALEDLDHVSVFLKDSPVLSVTRLYARLSAAHLHRRKGDKAKEEKSLDEAADDANFLGRFPEYPVGNFWRMHYYDFRAEFEKMERVWQNISEHGHRGYISDPYWAACFRTKQRFDHALKQLDDLPNNDYDYMVWNRLILRLEKTSGKIDAQEMEIQPGLFAVPALLLLGKHAEAKEMAGKELERLGKSQNLGLLRAIYQYLAGPFSEAKEKELIGQAGNSERALAEALYVIGLRNLCHGYREEARKKFDEIADGTMYHNTQFVWAQVLAERMEKDPTWPPWIPAGPDGTKKYGTKKKD